MLSIRFLTCLLLVLLVATPAALAAPATNPARNAAQITLDFKDVELTDLIQTVSELTGKNFVYDDTVRGKVTIVSPRGLSLNEAYQVFLSVLSVKGYTIVPAGKANKIVRTAEARENGLPTGDDGATGGADQYITRLVPLRYIDAATLASAVLTPLVPKTGSVVPYAPTNTLIITDSSANIERLLKIIAELDLPGTGASLEVILLKHAAAEEVAQLGTQVLGQLAGATQGARGPAGGSAPTATGKVLAYPRANAIVVMADRGELETIRALVRDLDRQTAANRSNINVFYLENADAEPLAKTLGDILATRQKSGKSGGGDAIGITADKATNSLVVNATPEDYATVHEIIRQLDIKRKQVFVEALILELSLEATQKLGTSLQGAAVSGSNGGVLGVSNQSTTSISSLTSVSSSNLSNAVQGIVAGGFFNMIDITTPDGKTTSVPAFSALIQLSKGNTDVNVLSAPRLLTSDNEEAQIVVGSNVPVITSRLTNAVGSSTTDSSGLATSVSVERKDVALTLRFTPQVTEGNLVRLKVFQEITNVSTNSVGDVNQVGPTFTKRLLQNTVIAQDGKTVVLGGLINSTSEESISKVPWLGDIPYIGWLFKRKETVEKKTNLMIFITPHIIRSSADLAAITQGSRGAMEEFRASEMRGAPQQSEYTQKALRAIEAQAPGAAPAAPQADHE